MFLKMCRGKCDLFDGSNSKYCSSNLCSFIFLGKITMFSKGSHHIFFSLNRKWGLGEKGKAGNG